MRRRPATTCRAAALLCVIAALAGCDEAPGKVSEFTGGSPKNGKAAIDHYGCASCHTIPGIRGANGLVGPPLNQIASRVYIGGVLTNTPENMLRWLRDPPAVDPKTAMPNVHLTDSDARDVAAYLYTLK
jgi:cytochrome c1